MLRQSGLAAGRHGEGAESPRCTPVPSPGCPASPVGQEGSTPPTRSQQGRGAEGRPLRRSGCPEVSARRGPGPGSLGTPSVGNIGHGCWAGPDPGSPQGPLGDLVSRRRLLDESHWLSWQDTARPPRGQGHRLGGSPCSDPHPPTPARWCSLREEQHFWFIRPLPLLHLPPPALASHTLQSICGHCSQDFCSFPRPQALLLWAFAPGFSLALCPSCQVPCPLLQEPPAMSKALWAKRPFWP